MVAKVNFISPRYHVISSIYSCITDLTCVWPFMYTVATIGLMAADFKLNFSLLTYDPPLSFYLVMRAVIT